MPTIRNHRNWRRDVQARCPVRSDDKKLCRMRLCPCRRLRAYEHDEWMKSTYGYFKAEQMMGLFEKAREARNGDESRTET